MSRAGLVPGPELGDPELQRAAGARAPTGVHLCGQAHQEELGEGGEERRRRRRRRGEGEEEDEERGRRRGGEEEERRGEEEEEE